MVGHEPLELSILVRIQVRQRGTESNMVLWVACPPRAGVHTPRFVKLWIVKL